MARGKQAAARTLNGVSKSKTRAKKVQEELPSDDEVEKFHKTKDKLSLNPAEDEGSSDDDAEDSDSAAIYNLSASDGSSDEDNDDEDLLEDDEENLNDNSRYAQRTASLILISMLCQWCTRGAPGFSCVWHKLCCKPVFTVCLRLLQ